MAAFRMPALLSKIILKDAAVAATPFRAVQGLIGA
jgi:hypothetical protein